MQYNLRILYADGRRLCCVIALLSATFSGALAQDQGSYSSRLEGIVLDGNGKPFQAEIVVMQILVREGRAYFASRCDTGTNSEGQYSCVDLPPGKYYIVARPHDSKNIREGVISDASNLGVPHVTIYPNTTDFSQATPIQLQENDTGRYDFNLPTQELFKIGGSIEEAPKSAAIALSLRSAGREMNTGLKAKYFSQSGKFTFSGIPNGQYRVVANWSRHGIQHQASEFVSLTGGDIENLQLSEQDELVVSGVCHSDRSHSGGPTKLFFESKDPSTWDQAAEIRKDGSFVVRGISPGDYFLNLSGGATVHVDSSEVGRETQTGSSVSIPSGAGPVNLEIHYSNSSAAIRGVVVASDGTGSHGSVILEEDESGKTEASSVDAQGKFTFGSIAPGRYHLFAWTDITDVEYRNPAFLRQYSQSSKEITVEAGFSVDDFELTPVDQ